jgi:uncharacterized membrane-anchored protein YhcB (DUF1043 family)
MKEWMYVLIGFLLGMMIGFVVGSHLTEKRIMEAKTIRFELLRGDK